MAVVKMHASMSHAVCSTLQGSHSTKTAVDLVKGDQPLAAVQQVAALDEPHIAEIHQSPALMPIEEDLPLRALDLGLEGTHLSDFLRAPSQQL